MFKGRKEPPLVLLSAKWLLNHRPAQLPSRSQLPADAVMPLAVLKRCRAHALASCLYRGRPSRLRPHCPSR